MSYNFSKIFFSIFAYFFLINIIEIKAQNYEPAIEYTSLLDMRYYSQSGGFLLEGLQVVFPPSDDQPFELIIFDNNNKKIFNLPLRLEQWQDFPAFGMLKPNGMPGNINIGKAGNYNLVVICSGKKITELPFELRVTGGDDPFNPQKNYLREGIWNSLGYLSFYSDKPDDALNFNFWMSRVEMPEGNKKSLCTLHLLKDGKEIAAARSAFAVRSDDWMHYKIQLFTPKNNFTLSMLENEDGNYEIQIKVKEDIVKRYAVAVDNGKVKSLKQSELGYEPSTEFLSPKLVDTSSGSNSSYKIADAFWVKRK